MTLVGHVALGALMGLLVVCAVAYAAVRWRKR